ncbi:MAG TPA: hypothetical protein VNT25_05515, partial [Allosphingosinicella sp.]|nr:hypothetical protein [Allosphingosinicella sp.]
SALTRVGEKPWRPQSWTVTTPGVRLERRGWHDVLVSETGTVPRRVRISFRPFPDDLLSDYDAAMVFTDGTVAIFSDHFSVFPLPTREAASALPKDLRQGDVQDVPTSITFRDRQGTVFHGGGRARSVTLAGNENYVLFGPAKPVETKEIATIIDPGLPEWLKGALTGRTLQLLSFYAERLGPRAGERPMLLVSWAGPTPSLRSMGGGVVPGQVLMTFEGDAILKEDPAVRASAQWFIGHEAAHFWLGNTVSYAAANQSWIMEGGADLLAVRAAAALDRSYDPKVMLQELADECVKLSAGRPVRDAALRNQQRAYYACGAMFGLAAEGAARRQGGDFFTFWRGLIDANRAEGIVSQEEWLAEVTRLSGDPLIADQIRQMVDVGVPDPARALAALFARSGVPHRLEGERLRLQ